MRAISLWWSPWISRRAPSFLRRTIICRSTACQIVVRLKIGRRGRAARRVRTEDQAEGGGDDAVRLRWVETAGANRIGHQPGGG